MLYTNQSNLLQILTSNSLFAKKRFGQNFLTNPHIVDSILEAGEVNQKDFVVEVGPGMGFLTQKLVNSAKLVQALEIDVTFYNYLTKEFATQNNLELINDDVLETSPPQLPYKLIANIPYYITSPILNHFFRIQAPALRPTLAVLLVQKEVAQKICAKTGDHSILSLQTQIFGKPEIFQTVKPGNFYPAPKVDSAILKITTYPQPLIPNQTIFFKLISAAFNQKRKTLENSLKNNLGLIPNQIDQLFAETQISPQIRPQALSIEQWKILTEKFTQLH